MTADGAEESTPDSVPCIGSRAAPPPRGAGPLPLLVHDALQSRVGTPPARRALLGIRRVGWRDEDHSVGAMLLLLRLLLLRSGGILSVEPSEGRLQQQQRCSSLESWWADYTASSPPAPVPPAESPKGQRVLAGPLLAAWGQDCAATPLSIDEVFAKATRLFSDDGLLPSAANDDIRSAWSVDDRESLALALLQHGLAREASAMHQRAKALIDGTATRLGLTRTAPDSFSSELGGSSALEIDLVPAHQATRDGTFLRNMSCWRPAAGTEQRKYNQDLLRQQLESGRRCTKGDCHAQCALGMMDGLVTDAEALRLIGHFRQVLRKTQRDAKEVKGKPMIDLARSVANSDLSEHLFFVRLVERVRSTASAVFGVPLQRLRLAVRITRQSNFHVCRLRSFAAPTRRLFSSATSQCLELHCLCLCS